MPKVGFGNVNLYGKNMFQSMYFVFICTVLLLSTKAQICNKSETCQNFLASSTNTCPLNMVDTWLSPIPEWCAQHLRVAFIFSILCKISDVLPKHNKWFQIRLRPYFLFNHSLSYKYVCSCRMYLLVFHDFVLSNFHFL